MRSGMQSRDLIDLAVFVATYGPELIRRGWKLPPQSLAEYWAVSQCRLDQWQQLLKRLSASPGSGKSAEAHTMRGLCEEILTAEMLTRVWCCVLTACDTGTGVCEGKPVAAGVMTGQIEATSSLLKAISSAASGTRKASMPKIDRLRELIEHWTDMLVGALGETCDISGFAHDPKRAGQFALDFGLAEIRPLEWSLMIQSMRRALYPRLQAATDNAELNGRLLDGVLASFPDDLRQTANVFWLTSKEPQVSKGQADAANSHDESHEHDKSVEEYIARLLGRDGGTAKEYSPTTKVASTAAVETLPEETTTPASIRPRSAAPETTLGLAAMREIANANTRMAIAMHKARGHTYSAWCMLAVALFAAIGGATMMSLAVSGKLIWPLFYGGVVEVSVSLLYLGRAAVSAKRARLQKRSIGQKLTEWGNHWKSSHAVSLSGQSLLVGP
jgi:hypothetical protein